MADPTTKTSDGDSDSIKARAFGQLLDEWTATNLRMIMAADELELQARTLEVENRALRAKLVLCELELHRLRENVGATSPPPPVRATRRPPDTPKKPRMDGKVEVDVWKLANVTPESAILGKRLRSIAVDWPVPTLKGFTSGEALVVNDQAVVLGKPGTLEHAIPRCGQGTTAARALLRATRAAGVARVAGAPTRIRDRLQAHDKRLGRMGDGTLESGLSILSAWSLGVSRDDTQWVLELDRLDISRPVKCEVARVYFDPSDL